MNVAISIATQCLTLWDLNSILWQAPCSSSLHGLGTHEGSFKTPTGEFHICEKIGAQAELGTVFKNRLPTGTLWSPDHASDEDLILTRILWLAGNQAENANTRQRFIYIHGTNQESLLGTPASQGCIRLSNKDMIILYDFVAVGTEVKIS